MPLYPFHCSECAEHFDVYRPMSQAADPVTHDCGSEAQRVWTTPPVRWTPEGYYLSPDDPNYWKGLKDHETRPSWQR